MLNLIKKYRKIVFTLMIVFISCFLGVENASAVPEGEPLSKVCTGRSERSRCVIDTAEKTYYLDRDYSFEFLSIGVPTVAVRRPIKYIKINLNGYTLDVGKMLAINREYINVEIVGEGIIKSTIADDRWEIADNYAANFYVYNYKNSAGYANAPTIRWHPNKDFSVLTLKNVTLKNEASLGPIINYGATINTSDAKLILENVKIERKYSDISDEFSDDVIREYRQKELIEYWHVNGNTIFNNVTVEDDLEGGSIIGGYHSNGTKFTNPSQIIINSLKTNTDRLAINTTDDEAIETFNINYLVDEKNVSVEPSTYRYGEETKLGTYTSSAYEVTQWLSNGEVITKVPKYQVGDVTYSAASKKALSFNINYYYGSTKLTDLEPITYQAGTKVTLPTYLMDGYTFAGWYTDKNYTTKLSSISTTTSGDKTLYAKMIPNSYGISYYDNDLLLTNLTPNSYTYGKELTLPTYNNPNYVGHEFKGWSTTKDGNNIIKKINVGELGNKTLYAIFNEIEYNVNYELNGGVNHTKNPQSYVYDSNEFKLLDGTILSSKSASLRNASKIGYTFQGWYNNADFTGNKITSITDTTAGNTTYYAKWSPNMYTIILDDNYGNTSTINAIYDLQLPKVNAPTKTGYKFEGYYTKEGVQYYNSSGEGTKNWDRTENTTLYAKWTPNQHIVTWVDGNGYIIYSEKINYDETPVYDETTYGIPEKDAVIEAGLAYTFKEWSPEISKVTGDVTYTATFNEILDGFKIDYYYGGTKIDGLEPHTYKVGYAVTLPEYTKAGYQFEGWYTSPKFEEDTKITQISATDEGDKTVYAKMRILLYNIEYYVTPSVHSGMSVKLSNTKPDSYSVDKSTKLPITGSIPGYDLDDNVWYQSSSYDSSSKTTTIPAGSTGDKTFYGIVTNATYNINYRQAIIYNGSVRVDVAINNLTPTSYTYGKSTALPQYTSYNSSAYIFEGWYNKRVLKSDYKVYNISSTDYGTKTFYAILTPRLYNIKYRDGDTVINDLAPSTYTYLDYISKLPTYEKEGYTFDGWYTDKNYTTKVTGISSASIGNKILFAKTTINQYTISFEENGGTDVADITADYNSEVAEPSIPNKEGHTFEGWYSDKELNTPYEFSVMPSENITLYAKWNTNKHNITWSNADGSEIYTEQVEFGKIPEYDEETYGVPTIEKDGNIYPYTGWSPEVTEVTGDKKYTAISDDANNTYNISYYNGDVKLEGLEPTTYKFNIGTELPSYQVGEYLLESWYTSPTFEESTKIEKINESDYGDKILYAKLIGKPYIVTWLNADGIEIYSEEVEYGTIPSYDEETYGVPTIEKDGYMYTFKNWDPEIVEVIGNVTYKAVYEELANTYNITYYNGETKIDGLEPSNYVYGIGVALPYYEAGGYKLESWYTSPTFEESAKIEKINDTDLGDKVLYAKTTKGEYTISFEENGGTEVETITKLYGELVEKPVNPTREHYTFDSWYTDETFENEYTFDTMPGENITLYAKWIGDPYTITWLNIDNSEIYSEEVEYGNIPVYDEKTYGIPINNEAVEAGYENKFIGWNPEIKEVTENAIYTAVYEKTPLEYNINYYVNGIKLTDVTPSVYSYGIGVVLPDLNLPGYKLLGWYTTNTFEEDTKITEISKTTIGEVNVYAKVDIDEYTISFEENGGTEVEDITKTFGEIVETPISPTKENYSFAGWYVEPDFLTEYEFTTMPRENVTLYAKWIGDPYTITWFDSDNVEIYSEQVEFGSIPVYDEETYGVPTYEEDGYLYTFAGWEPEIEKVTGDATYKAKFNKEANIYNITYYDGESVIANLSPITYEYGIGTELPVYEKEGYVFEGWYTSLTFEDDTKIENISTIDFGDKELYAKVNVQKYIIDFEENGGTDVETIIQDYGTEIRLPISTKDGYTLEGWYTDETLENKFEADTMPAENLTLYAKWVEGVYEISYYNGNTKIENLEPSNYIYSVGTNLPTEVEGYTLEGWYTSPTFEKDTKVENISTTDFGNKILYGKLLVNAYTITFEENGGSQVEDIMEEYGTEIRLPITTKEGHTLEGWYTDETLENKFEADTMPAENLTLYAKWSVNEYEITWLDGNGEEIYSEKVQYNQLPVYDTEIGEPFKTSEDPAISYKFIGWDPEITPVFEDTTYTAQFEESIMQYSIVYIDNKYEEIDLSPNTYIYGVETELPIYEKEGYTFEGWYTTNEFEDDTKIESISATDSGSKTLYAKLVANEYTITFNENGGSEVTDIKAGFETPIELPTPTLDGYTLEGWYTDEALENKFEATTMPAENITLYAKWEVTKYTINFNENDGTEVEDIIAEYGTPVTKPVDPTKEGYTFDGWYSDEELNTPYVFTTMPAENITVYAKWNVNEYTINFESNGGSIVESITGNYGTEVTAPVDPTKEGNVFDGWYSDETLENLYTFDTMPAENITLYAKWFTNEYTITFNTLGGTEIDSITQEYGTLVEAPEIPTREYSSFAGWYLEPEYITEYEFTTMPAEDIILYAKWDIGRYTITYANPDGSVIYTEEVEYATIPEYDEATYGIPTYNKTGYTTVFKKWDKEFTMAEEDTTYTALYDETVNNYSIEYYYGNVLLEGLEPTIYTYEVGAELPEYTLEYYTFNGWYTSPTFEEDTKVEKISETDFGDKVLYANMILNQYTISFEENGGSEIEDITADYNSVVTAPVEPTKEGYTFDGWYSDEELNTPYIFTTMPAENITVYAAWNINQYTITFVENGGTEVEDITADYNSTVTKPVDPTKEHYTFDNWYIDPELTTPYEFSVMPLNGITLYAKWIGDLHTITWLNVDGTEIYTEQAEYGALPEYDTETYGVPTYEKDGYTYTFTGWDPEVTEVTGDVTYKATYSEEVNTYSITYYYGETKLEGIDPTSYVYGIGTELPLYELDGYRFEGWYTSNAFEEDTKLENISVTDFGDKVLYAKMVRSEFTITFEENGGSEVEDITKTAGEEVTAPTTTRDGYVFDGWYSDIDLTNPYEFSVMPEENITLYAKWSEITIEVLNKDIVMFVDDEEQIEITTTPEDAVLTFNYTPSTDIISVSEEGLIKGLTDGEATITVKVLENPNIEEVITVKVHSKEIESETYGVEQKEDVKIIVGMDEGVTIEELLETLSNNKDHINVYDKDGNKLDDYTKVVSTGLNIKLETEDKVYDEVKVILRGDIDGDGIINVTDEAILSEHILFISTIEDYTKYAADIVVDDIIDVTDDSVLTEYILKMIPTLK